jgi:hypothetical protein
MDTRALWTTADRERRFLIPDGAELPEGDLELRTVAGRTRRVDEAAARPFEVTEEEAQAWAENELGATLAELRGKALGFAERLNAQAAALREENRTAWAEGAAGAPENLADLAEHLRARLRDLGQALQRAARERGAAPPDDPEAPA